VRPVPVRTEGVEPSGDRARRAAVLTAVRTLRSWDKRRAAAYARGDVAALRRLYVPGSRAAVADARVLASYLARGLVVRGLRMQLLEVRHVEATGSRLRLTVEDRVVGAAAGPPTGGRSVDLPADLPSTRVVSLVRDDGSRWRVRSVRASPPVSAGPRPAGR
jgi:hypothetical protein